MFCVLFTYCSNHFYHIIYTHIQKHESDSCVLKDIGTFFLNTIE